LLIHVADAARKSRRPAPPHAADAAAEHNSEVDGSVAEINVWRVAVKSCPQCGHWSNVWSRAEISDLQVGQTGMSILSVETSYWRAVTTRDRASARASRAALVKRQAACGGFSV
jgi:hypothetical protein